MVHLEVPLCCCAPPQAISCRVFSCPPSNAPHILCRGNSGSLVTVPTATAPVGSLENVDRVYANSRTARSSGRRPYAEGSCSRWAQSRWLLRISGLRAHGVQHGPTNRRTHTGFLDVLHNSANHHGRFRRQRGLCPLPVAPNKLIDHRNGRAGPISCCCAMNHRTVSKLVCNYLIAVPPVDVGCTKTNPISDANINRLLREPTDCMWLRNIQFFSKRPNWCGSARSIFCGVPMMELRSAFTPSRIFSGICAKLHGHDYSRGFCVAAEPCSSVSGRNNASHVSIRGNGFWIAIQHNRFVAAFNHQNDA